MSVYFKCPLREVEKCVNAQYVVLLNLDYTVNIVGIELSGTNLLESRLLMGAYAKWCLR